MKNLSSYAVIAVLTLAFLAFISIGDNLIFDRINAQGSPTCTPPPPLAPGKGFRKDAPVTVHVNSAQFSPAQFNCLKTAFDNWNSANQNTNGIRFTVTRSPDIIVTASGTANTQITNPVQVNSGAPPAPNDGGNTKLLGADGQTTAAYTVINPAVTDCEALTQTMAHEIGHMMGLDDCDECPAGTSVMNGVPCDEGPNGQPTNCNFNDTENGRSAPSTCDSTTATQHASATPPPAGTPTPGGDDGGGDCRGTEDCGGGDDPPNCHTESYEDCGYDGECDEWDSYTGTCTVYPGYDYCYTVWYEVCN